MLLIEHYVDKSPIHGLGVFSSVWVKANTKIYEFDPLIDIVIKKEALNELPLHVQQRIQMRAEFYEDAGVFILGADGDSFMNHSDDPNLFNIGRETYALRDIEPGEELTCDYRSIVVITFDVTESKVNKG